MVHTQNGSILHSTVYNLTFFTTLKSPEVLETTHSGTMASFSFTMPFSSCCNNLAILRSLFKVQFIASYLHQIVNVVCNIRVVVNCTHYICGQRYTKQLHFMCTKLSRKSKLYMIVQT